MGRLSVFCAEKAGMTAVDTVHVNSVVYEMSKDSAHFRNLQARAAKASLRIAEIKRRVADIRSSPPSYLAALTSRAQSLLSSLESERDLSHCWLHLDIDAFYASVELLRRPHLRHLPVAVGGMSMISTSNYIARQYGVRSAMPGFIAVRLCPQLVFVPCDFKRYGEVARVFRAIFAEYDPEYESASMDEAYLDVTDWLRRRKEQAESERGEAEGAQWDQAAEASRVAEEIRRRVQEATQLTCSCGIAANRMLAKIATDLNKPNGQYCLPSSLPAILSFTQSLPIRKVGGVGKVMERVLNEGLGVSTVGQLRSEETVALMLAVFSPGTSRWLCAVGLGLGRAEHEDEEERRRKSVSIERTFRDIDSLQELEEKVQDLSRGLSEDVQRLGVRGRTLTLKMKTATFEVKQRSVSLQRWIHDRDDLHRLGHRLLMEELNTLLAGRRLHRTAQQAQTQAAPSLSSSPAAVPAASSTPPSPALATAEVARKARAVSGSPFDGLLRLRLMGLRLSALHQDDAHGEEGEDGDEEAAGQAKEGKKAGGNMSILRFAKKLPDAPQDSDAEELQAELKRSSSREEAEAVSSKRADDGDISRYFGVASPAQQQEREKEPQTAGKGGRKRSRRSIEDFFHSAASTASVPARPTQQPAEEDDDVLLLDDEADEADWLELIDPAASATQDGASSLSGSAAVPAPLAPDSSPLLPPLPPAPASSPVLCPICEKAVSAANGSVSNLSLNAHIDRCLATGGGKSAEDGRLQGSRKREGRAGDRIGKQPATAGRKRRHGTAVSAGPSLESLWKRKAETQTAGRTG